MKIKFACPACGKPHAVDAALAGKKGRCKDCGAVMRLPDAPRPATVRSGPTISDPYGLDEEAPAASAPLPPRRAATEFDEPAGSTGPRRVKPSGGRKKASRGEPWNLPLRYLGVKCTMMAVAGALLGLVILAVSAALTSRPLAVVALVVMGIACLIGIPGKLLTWVSVLGAFVSLIRGNGRAFSGESPGAQVVWGLAVLLSVGDIGLFLAALPTAIYSARQAAERRDGLVPEPGPPGFAGHPGFPGDPGSPGPPGFSLPPRRRDHARHSDHVQRPGDDQEQSVDAASGNADEAGGRRQHPARRGV